MIHLVFVYRWPQVHWVNEGITNNRVKDYDYNMMMSCLANIKHLNQLGKQSQASKGTVPQIHWTYARKKPRFGDFCCLASLCPTQLPTG